MPMALAKAFSATKLQINIDQIIFKFFPDDHSLASHSQPKNTEKLTILTNKPQERSKKQHITEKKHTKAFKSDKKHTKHDYNHNKKHNNSLLYIKNMPKIIN